MPVMPASNVPSGRTAARLMAAAVLLLCATAPATGCSRERSPSADRAASDPATSDPATSDQATAGAAQNGVQVTVVVSADAVRATFRPERPGFHLYSIGLPVDGVDGVGVPTELGVKGGLRATAAPTSDQPVRQLNIPGVAGALPVYPDGPVTLTMPVARTGSPDAQVVVSYGACSTTTCLLPVSGLVIPVRLR
ncbi:hypothetical protein GCM10010440_56740 [Kitasatospora cinereorecta]